MNKQTANNFTLRSLLSMLFSKKIVFFSIFSFIVAITMMVICLASPTYTSSSTVIVKSSDNAPVLIGSNARRAIIPVTMEALNNAVTLIRSKEVQEKTVLDLKLHEPQLPEKNISLIIFKIKKAIKDQLITLGISEERDPVENAIFYLDKDLQVEAKALSNIIVIRYTGTDPAQNAAIVNSITENYINKHIKVYQEKGGAAFLNNQKNLFKYILEQTEQQLASYQQKNTIIDPASQIISNLSIRETLLVTAKYLETELREKEARINELQLFLAETTRDNIGLVLDKELREIPGIIEYQKALITLTIELGRATPRYPKDSFTILDIKKQIKNLKLSMKKESKTILSGDAIALHALKNKKTELNKQLNSLNKENLRLTKQQIKLNQLKREIIIAENSYLLYSEKTEEARILAEKKRSKIVNVTVISRAEPATIVVFPKKTLLLVIAIFIGCMAGLSGTVVANYMDHSLKTPQNISDNTTLPYLGGIDSLPKENPSSAKYKQKQGRVDEQLEKIANSITSLEPASEKKSFIFVGSHLHKNDCPLTYNIASIVAENTPDKKILLVKNSHRLQLFSNTSTKENDFSTAMDFLKKSIHQETLSNLSTVRITDTATTKCSLNQIIRTFNGYYDSIIFDFPFPSEKLHQKDIAGSVDHIVLVAEAEKSKGVILEQHTEAIRNAGGNIAGVILNNRQYHIPEFIYNHL